jgi:hypothetical protein
MIRINNIDFETEGMKRHSQMALTDTTAGVTNTYTIFSAPVDCIVENVIVTHKSQTSDSMTARLYLAESTATLLAAVTTASYSAFAQISFTITSNNSLTAGALLGLTLHCSGTDGFHQPFVDIKWKPNKHRGN